MSKCPCDKMTSGDRAYDCDMLGCRMYPHFCRKFLDDPRFQEMYLRGGGPTQLGRIRKAARDQTGPKKKRTLAGIDRPAVPKLSQAVRQTLATRLAELSESSHPLENPALYAKPLAQWADADCETRDDDEQAFVLRFCRGGCPLDQRCLGRCPKYHVQSDSCQCGQGCGARKEAIPLAIRAVMASESCAGVQW